MLGLIGLDIPGLRQIVGFLFFAFVPGILLLRILKIHNIGVIESLLYSVGLSIAFVMATGVVVNFALPPLGISHPITLLPLTVGLTIFSLILGFLAYKRDKGFHPPRPLGEDSKESANLGFGATINPFFVAVLLPLLAVLGASLVNSYHNNTLLLALIFAIVLLIGLVAFNKFVPAQLYPLMIVMMALALLYQNTFISDYVVGSDIHQEHYWGKLVIENGYWNATIRGNINSCLSIVMLAPIYSLLLNMDITWLYKIIYPLFFSLLPLVLFRIFQLQIGSRYAFLATFFFIAMPMFFMDMAQLVRQQVSELFFVLVILLMVDRKLTVIQRTTLVIVFGFGVIVSYYSLGTGYAIGYLAFGALLLIGIKSRPGRTFWQRLIGKSNALPPDLTSAGAFPKKALAVIVGVSLVFMFGYYSVTASGASLCATGVAVDVVQSTSGQIITGITAPPTETPPAETPPAETPPAIEQSSFIQDITSRFPFLDPLRKEPLLQTALGIDFGSASLGGKAWRIFQYLVEICLVVGVLRLIFRPRTLGFNFKAEYISMTIVSILILFGLYILATRAWGLGGVRIFHIALLLMAPLFLFGSAFIWDGTVKLARVFRSRFASSQSTSAMHLQVAVLAILIPYFVFNSGVVFELSRSQSTHYIDVPYSIALSSHRVDISSVFAVQDVIIADWLSGVAEEDHTVYADHHGRQLFIGQVRFPCVVLRYRPGRDEVDLPCYFYLRAWNLQKRTLTFATTYGARQSISFDDMPWLVGTMEKADRIYDNGGTRVLALN